MTSDPLPQNSGRLKDKFVSETVFNLSKRVLSEAEIRVLEKGLNFSPIQSKINEPELKLDFEDFARCMRLKWYFRNKANNGSEDHSRFKPRSIWKPPKGHMALQIYLEKIRKEIFEIPKTILGYSNLSKEEWEAVRSLADDSNIVTKKADKGSSAVVWDRDDYLAEAYKQL